MESFPVDAVPPIGDYCLSADDKALIQTAYIVFKRFTQMWMDDMELAPLEGTHREVLSLLRTAHILTITPLATPVHAAVDLPHDYVPRIVSLSQRFGAVAV